MKTLIGIGLLAFALGGCVSTPAGLLSIGSFTCSGKGTVSILGSGVNGFGGNGGNLTADCGGDASKGFSFSQTAIPAPAKP